jgi:hypothetical protein
LSSVPSSSVFMRRLARSSQRRRKNPAQIYHLAFSYHVLGIAVISSSNPLLTLNAAPTLVPNN